MKNILLAGLTGNYGSGKSFILEKFRKMGALAINSDEIVRTLLKKNEIKKEVSKLLGEKVLTEDGELDRKAIADIIFRDAYLRLKLEDIIHPEVFKEIKRLISEVKEDKVIIVEIPVLFERGYQNRFHKIITVYADEATILRRLQREGLSKEEISKRWEAQFPYEKKIRSSDFVIDNSEGRDIDRQIVHIYSQLQKEIQKGDRYGDQETGGY